MRRDCRRPTQGPPEAGPPPGKASWPTDGYDVQRTSWQRHETLISPASVKGMKLVWKLKLDNASRQLHNLFPPMIVSDVRTAQRAEADRRRRRRLGQRLRHRPRHRHAALEAHFDNTFTEQAAAATARCVPGGLTATPVIGPAEAGQVHRLRGVVGRPAAAARRRHRPGRAPPELFVPPNGKPYGLNLYKA